MKKIYFLFLQFFIASIFTTAKPVAEQRKQEIIQAIQNNNETVINGLSNDEVNADLGTFTINLDYSKPTIKNATPLALACELFSEKIIKILLEKNANIFHQYSMSYGYSESEKKPIEKLDIEKYHEAIANWLIHNSMVNQTLDKENNTILHKIAAHDECLESFKKLVNQGANIAAQNGDGKTPLHSALVTGYNQPKGFKIAQFMLQKTNIDLTKKYTYKTTYSSLTESLFKTVIGWGQSNEIENAIDNILRLGKYNEKLNDNDDRLIHYLAQDDNNLDQMKKLIAKNPNLEITNKKNQTALHIALDKKQSAIIQELLKSKKFNLTKQYSIDSNYGIQNETLFEKLWLDAPYENIDQIRNEIIRNIIDANQESAHLDTKGNQLLHYLARSQNIFSNWMNQKDIAQKLKTHLEAKNNNNETPLYIACSFGSLQVVKDLIQLGAQTNIITKDENTLLHKAAQAQILKDGKYEENLEMLNYLLENTQSQNLINQKNSDGKTAIELVIHNAIQSYEKCAQLIPKIKLLLQYGAKKDGLEQMITSVNVYNTYKASYDQVIQAINDTSVIKAPSISSTPPSTPPSSPKYKKKKGDPLTKNLGELSKKLSALKKKLSDLATQLGYLKGTLK